MVQKMPGSMAFHSRTPMPLPSGGHAASIATARLPFPYPSSSLGQYQCGPRPAFFAQAGLNPAVDYGFE